MTYLFKSETHLQRCVIDFLIKCNHIGHDFNVVPNVLDHMAESDRKKRMLKIQGAKAIGYEDGQSDLIIFSSLGVVFLELKNGKESFFRNGKLYGKAINQNEYLKKMKLKAGVIGAFFGYDITQIINKLRELYKIDEFEYKIKQTYLI